jgi:hypothetical protein
LKNGLDRAEPIDARRSPQASLPLHDNVRGSAYYANTPHPEGETNDAQ